MDKELKEELGELKTQLEKHVDQKLAPVNEWQKKKDEDDKKNQDALDDLLKWKQAKPIPGTENKTFGNVFGVKMAEEFNKKQAEIKAFQNDKNAKLSFELKAVGTMTTALHLTGDGVMSYNNRQGIIPSQKTNFRDLIPSVSIGPNGNYVTYNESGGEGAIGAQVEGEEKEQLTYEFTQVKTVTGYIAGWVRFAKQMMFQLPWLQTTLMRLLLRDFYKKENATFYAAVAAVAAGFDTTGEINNVKALIDFLMGRADSDFNSSYILVRNSEKGELLKMMFENGYYAGSGSVLGLPDGTVRIADVPVIGVSWATPGKVMIIDNDFIERVESENLRVEFSYEDATNFTHNLVTARVECMEDLNLLRTDAHTYTDSPTSAGS